MRISLKGSLAVAAAIAVLLGFPAFSSAAPIARLAFQSDVGDFIGQGATVDITYTPANSDLFSAQVRRSVGTPPGLPAQLLFLMGTVAPDPDNTFASVSFGTDQLGAPIVPGTYPDAERADFASSGHPGLDISFQNRGCNTLTGSFVVTDATFTTDGVGNSVIQSFVASFEQHCEGAIPRLVGTFSYFADAARLVVSKAGIGSGTVTSSPAGIDCGATCSSIFSFGAAVTLTAVPAAGSTFTGWSGACNGTGACNVTMNADKSVTATFSSATDAPRLTNISTRMMALTGDDVPIAGFVIGGSVRKAVLLRARGQSMAPSGVPNTLINPMLQLFTGQTLVDSNDDWVAAPNAVAIEQSGLAPGISNESAIYRYLDPGAYTAIVTGVGGATGNAIVEVFEMGDPESPFMNISTRGMVQTGDSVMIGGFVITGDSPKSVLITARGPSLAAFGITNALANPNLQLVAGQTVIASNDDFGTSTNLTQIQATGNAPTNPLESAILITLNPGNYTAIVSGVGGGTGVGIVEVFAQ
jgi:hypothetical protein